MNLSGPVFRGLLILEALVAYALPFILLVMVTILALSNFVTFVADPSLEVLGVVFFIIGGYLGMLGVYRQLVFLLYEDEESPDLSTFIFTLIGCIAVLPFTWLGVGAGQFFAILIGIAPILVAIQLTFMNRQQLYLTLKANKEKC